MFPADSVIECTTFVDSTIEPQCLLMFPAGPMGLFDIDFDSITDTRLTVRQSFEVPGDAVVYQLFKLNHD